MKKNLLSLERAVAIAFALIRTAICCYRAATQSFTEDESVTFSHFVAAPWREVYFRYEANNHVLFSILSKLSMSLFGNSELALRLPSVIAGFFLMLAVWCILERVDSRPVRWVAFLAIGLHPLILDFSVAARGYGLATALFAWALYAAMTRRNVTAGILLGLAVSANLTAAFPAMGLLVAGLLLEECAWPRRLRAAMKMALPAAATVLIVLGGSLSGMSQDKFYVGITNIRESLFKLIYVSILSTSASSRHGLFGTEAAARILEYAALPAISLLIVTGSILSWRRGDRRSMMAPLAFALAVSGMIAAHRLTGLLYPIDRTGVAFMLLFGLAWAAAAGHMRHWLIRGANLLAGGLLVIQFATQFHVGFFYNWAYDRSTKNIAHRIEREIRGKPPGSISIGASWVHQPALEYYRVHDRIEALKPIEFRDPTQVTGHDYYVLNRSCFIAPPKPESSAGGGGGDVKNFAAAYDHGVLFSDPFAGVILASEAGSSRPAFFKGEETSGTDGVYFLRFPQNGNVFGYYTYQSFPWVYHYDLGLECFLAADDGSRDANLFDAASGHWFYTGPTLFPYLYDTTLGVWLLYHTDTNNPGHYTTKPRYFFNTSTKQTFAM